MMRASIAGISRPSASSRRPFIGIVALGVRLGYLDLCEGWRLSEDGELQWIVEQWRKPKWRPKAYCGTKAGLLEVALPHHRIAAPDHVIVALLTASG